jgi:hypothetical protein
VPGRPPIIDMHAHALRVDSQGPPPLAFPLHAASHLVHDPQRDWSDEFREWFKESNPGRIPSPATDAELKRQTLEAIDQNNVIGVFSGPFLTPPHVRSHGCDEGLG